MNILRILEQKLSIDSSKPALISGSSTLTYAEVKARSSHMAALLHQHGARPGKTIGLCLDRSPELIISVLGIVQAGAAYVPIDPTYPAERIAGMLEDAKPPVVITSKANQHLFKGTSAKVLLIEDIDQENGPVFEGPCPAKPDDLLYVLFTSGSTGRPKGVAMHHAPLMNLIQWQLRTSVCKEGDRTLQFAPISFDVSFQEIFTTFAQGGTLVLITDEDRLNSTQLLRKIIAQKLNRIIVPFVALQYLAEAVERTGEVPSSLKEVFTSGEQLKVTPAIINLFKQLPGCRFCNQYGPTEGHVVSELELKGDPTAWPALPNIGSAIDNVKLYVLDEQMKPVPTGEEGELYLGGACVAKGYIGRDDLTAERFLADPFINGDRMYRTGDRAAELPNGEIDYKGRIDGQVKVRGYRIELGEVEVAMEKHPDVEQAVANVREDRPGLKRLIGYYVAKSELSTNELRKHLASLLPDYMQPSAFVAVKELPRTPSGKIDRKALPAPDVKRPDLDVAYAGPTTAVQKTLANVWADLLGIDRVGIDDNFFDLGGNSLLSIQCVAQLEGHGLKLPIVKLYQHPTIRACAAFLEGDASTMAPSEMAKARVGARHDATKRGDVAIIGMSGRFPGAESVEQLWQNLLAKKNSISTWTVDELDPSIPAELRNDPDYVKARGVIADADKFDAGFFGVNPKVAALMDPQQRVFLETAWAALEDAAYDPAQFAGLIGVYAGMGNNTYFTRNVIGHPELIEQVGDFAVMTANEKDYIATRLAFEFDLRGPALSIHTACSTSLVAIAQAFKALRDGECDMALAGGISLTVPFNSGIVYNEGGMYSPDGSTRTFDANGKGTSFSDGCGIIVLKRLDDAVRDKDHIYAVIKGAALNNDGSDKASFTAPSVRGQAEVIAMAQADAGVSPSEITYVETHGTATPLGDPIEVEALTLAFGGKTNGHHCVIGSIKSNIGHLTPAAGAAGVIKTALALREEVIPANVGFETPNPAIDFANSPFRVLTEREAWPRVPGTPRIAGVSSFGVGGTNAHVILAEPPVAVASSASRDKQLFLLSAKSKTSLDAMTDNLRTWLLLDSARSASPSVSLADAAYTLQVGRRHFKHRRLIVGGSHNEVIEAIANKDAQLIGTRELHEAAPGVVFMFPGQGSQYVNMGRDLCASEPVFKQHFDQCCELFSKEFGTDLKAIIFPKAGDEEKAAEQLKQTIYTQASLFTMHYSLAKLWMHWGIVPDAMMGHSIGEFAAGCLAGVFSLEDAVKLVANRGRMMQELPGGSMLSVRAAEEDVVKKLPAGCSIAANNGPQLCVASGPHEAIAKLQAELEKEGITCKLLVTSHAFHSPMMDAIVEPYKKVVESVKLNAPRIPIVSTVTAEWLKDDEATSSKYWSDHLRATVRFAQAVKFAWQDADRVMLEVGPRTTATTLARQQSSDNKKQAAVPSLGDSAGNGNELTQLLKAVGGLWQSGVLIDWNKFYDREERCRISMPTYAFERIRHWVDPVAMVADGGRAIASTTIEAPVPNSGDANLSPKESLIAQIKHLLEESSGLELAEASNEETFLEMGLDSLFLTQVATSLSKKFGVKISFRQLNEELPNLDKLADHLLANGVSAGGSTAVAGAPAVATGKDAGGTLNALEDAPELKKVFGAQARISKEKVDDMTPQQRAWFDAFVKRYVAKTAKSKAFTQENRKPMADPRVVTGFKPQTKELIYQVVVDKSTGCHLWDIDGNEYVDILSGFGSSMFGYMPDFIKEACHKQIDTSVEIGPMHPLAAEVSKLLCELTGAERAAVCNTGSEAVLGAMRMARTVTGRSLIISFSGSYHGINDEVIIRGSKSKKSYPGAPGIMPQAVENMLVLDYGTPESLEIIKQRCHEAAAVLVEPVQSRRMEFRPVDFLREVRRITQENGTALIFDEVITGFRTHQNGTQGLFGIQADIGTYGKVIGGGMPVGAMIGKSEWMDALDGGHWQFGDDSVPPAGVTYFAGTFVRHPLTMAAMKASLVYMKNEGPALQERLNTMTEDMVARVNGLFDQYQLPYRWVNFGSAFKTKYDESVNYTELFFMLMRYHGVHVLDFPHFITTAHTAADIEFIINAVEKTCKELRESGFMPERTYPIPTVNSVLGGHVRKLSERVISAMEPPVAGARLGRTPKGEPAWFVPDPKRQGKYLMVETEEN